MQDNSADLVYNRTVLFIPGHSRFISRSICFNSFVASRACCK